MFVKTSENQWINFPQCERIEIEKNESNNWEIGFYYPSNDSNTQRLYSIGAFRLEIEAQEALDEIWEAYRKGKPYFEPDPRSKMNVRLGDKWYADDEPIQTYLEAIQLLGLEKIEEQGLTFKDRNAKNAKEYPIVTKEKVKHLNQSNAGEYWILLPDRTTTMKEILESIASKIGIIAFEVTIYQN